MSTTLYELVKRELTDPKPGEFSMTTAAMWSCATCGEAIAGMGGPGNGEVCVRCAELIRSGRARGCIVWWTDEPAALTREEKA